MRSLLYGLLRGHGNSDKPLEPERYKDSKAWADEL
jgi:non-heme chloroperoxidase